MSTDNDLIRIRKEFLDAVNDPREDTDSLRAVLGEFQSSHPGILVTHIANDNFEPIDHNALHWTETYFSTQRDLAKRNFSMERLSHLVEVRERFRQDGRKGFVPKAATSSDTPTKAGNGYRPSLNLRKFVDEGDLQTIQTALIVEVEDHRIDAASLRAALAWAKAQVPGLCEAYTEKAFAKAIDPDRQKWTSDYYAKQSVYLETNFAEERYLHLIDVREHLRRQEAKASTSAAPGASRPAPKAQPGAKPASGTRASEPPRRPAQQPSSRNLSPALSAALLVGGALAVVVILLLVLRK